MPTLSIGTPFLQHITPGIVSIGVTSLFWALWNFSMLNAAVRIASLRFSGTVFTALSISMDVTSNSVKSTLSNWAVISFKA